MKFARAVELGMMINAAIASVAATGFATGFIREAAGDPSLARLVGARELAGAFVMAFVARRLRKDPSLVVLPLVVVFLNFACSAYEVVGRGNTTYLPPMIVEGTFFALYALFSLRQRVGLAA